MMSRTQRTLQLQPDTQLRATLAPDPRRPDVPVIELRLYRRAPYDVGADDFVPSRAGFFVPVHLAGELVRHLEALAHAMGNASREAGGGNG